MGSFVTSVAVLWSPQRRQTQLGEMSHSPTRRRQSYAPDAGCLLQEPYSAKASERLWLPSASVAFRLLFSIRVAGAMYASVTADCDEGAFYSAGLRVVLTEL